MGKSKNKEVKKQPEVKSPVIPTPQAAAAKESASVIKDQAESKMPDNTETAAADKVNEGHVTSDGQKFADEALAKIHQRSLDAAADKQRVSAENQAALEEKAQRYLKQNPTAEEIHLTSDGQAFFSLGLARAHQTVINKDIQVSTFKR